MGEERSRYLANLHGFGNELLGGDPDEIVLRASWVGEGTATPRDLAHDLRAEAGRYERLHRDGWALVEPFAAGQARCRKDAPTGGSPASTPPAGDTGTGDVDVAAHVDGAASLPEAAARLRAAAAAVERAAGG